MTHQRLTDRIVMVPTYNEAGTIRPLIDRIREADPRSDILVIDDGSPDRTSDIVRTFSHCDGHVFLIFHPHKAGLGAAYSDGAAWAAEQGYARIAQMDADLSHRPEELPAFWDALEACDLVIGSRFAPGGRAEQRTIPRRIVSYCGTAYARRLLGLDHTDVTSGFRAYSRATAKVMYGRPLQMRGYAFQIETLYRATREGLRVTEIPIQFVERGAGRSKFHAGLALEAVAKLHRLRND
ncbi:MAG: polyprenol monophosphomannose synthase [Deltaproteobacteria bacterium]|nr:polyprenol monophosphomannose synthase [Deltaproteobacteria bacterium]